MDNINGLMVMSEQEARAICDQFVAILPGFEWIPRERRAGGQGWFGNVMTWSVFGHCLDDARTVEIRPTAQSSASIYRVEVYLDSNGCGNWCAYAADPMAAYREAVAFFEGRWEDAAAHRAYCAAIWRSKIEDLEADIEGAREALADLGVPVPGWAVCGADGERVFCLSRDGYKARICEGRVWRWQAGSDETPDIYAGRIVGSLEDAQRAAAAALVLLELGALSDLAPEHVHKHPGRST